MRIVQLQRNPATYTCRSYLILGDWNQLGDLNTLIDPGTDDFIIPEIERLSTGFGKVAVEQVILTHNHFDHCAGAAAVKARFGCRVYGFSPGPEVDEPLYDGQFLKMGDGFGEILHTPGHSSDSIAVYLPENKALFCGDTQLRIRTPGGKYTREYVRTLLKLAQRDISVVYPGHDEPFDHNVRSIILDTLQNVRNSQVDQ